MGHRNSNCSRGNPNDTVHLRNDEVMITSVYDTQDECRWEMSGEDLLQVEGMALHMNGECSGKYIVGEDEWQIPTLNNTVSSCIAFYHYNRTNSCGKLESIWKKGCWPQVVYNNYTLTFTPNLHNVNNFTVMYEPLSCNNISSKVRFDAPNWTSFGLVIGIILLSMLLIALTVIIHMQRKRNLRIKKRLLQQHAQQGAAPKISAQSQSYEDYNTERDENRATMVLGDVDGYELPSHYYTEATVVYDLPEDEYENMSPVTHD